MKNFDTAQNISIGIIGLGSIGCLIASQLPKSVTCYALLRHEAKHLDFTIEDKAGSSQYHLPAWQGHELDLIIICCKASQTLQALTQWQPAITSNTQIVLLQNGLGQHDQVHHIFPKNTLYAASTTEGANRLGRNKICHAGIGITQWGYYAGPKKKLVLNALSLTGKHQINENIKQVLLDKLAINAVINPLTVKYQCVNGDLLMNESAFSEFKKLCTETESIFSRLDWNLSFKLFDRAQQIAQQTSKNISSMLQDIRNHQETEIEYINNHLVNKAKEKGFSAPLNQALVELIKNEQSTLIKQ